MYSTAFLKFSLKISALCVLWLCQPSPGYFRFATQFLNYSLKFPPTAVVLCNILLHIFKIQSLKYESGPLSIYQNCRFVGRKGARYPFNCLRYFLQIYTLYTLLDWIRFHKNPTMKIHSRRPHRLAGRSETICNFPNK